MARPQKKKTEQLSTLLRIRVTPEQKDAFERAAARDGLDVSGFVRQAAIVKARSLGIDV